MSVILETLAYAKMILHAAKYPYDAINGVLLADGCNIKESAKNQDLNIVDAELLFHQNHYVTPMIEVAMTNIEALAHANVRVVAGYYAACENFGDNTVEKCPGQKIAEKIVEHFPSAIFIVVDNKKLSQHLDASAIKVHKFADGKWKPMDPNKFSFKTQYAMETVSHLLQRNVQMEVVDFDDYLDDIKLDRTNPGVQKLIAKINATNTMEMDE